MTGPVTRMTAAAALSGIPPHLQGSRGALSYAQAVYQAANGQPVFPEGCSITLATTDLADMCAVHASEPNLNWFLRAYAQDGIVVLRANSVAHLEQAERFYGKLPRTLTIMRAGSEVKYLIFLRSMASPLWVLNRDVANGVKVQVVSSSPLHANVHAKSGTRYEWAEYSAPGEVCPAYMPRGWTHGLPRRLASKTLFVEPRHEWRPPTSPLWCGN